MSVSISEKGKAKTLANTGLLLTHIYAKGENYKPSNAKLLVPNLEAVSTKATQVQSELNFVQAPYSNAVLQRENIFLPLNRYISKLRKAYKAVDGLTEQQLENFMTVARKIKGARKTKKEKDNTSEQHSVSQMSYDQRTNNMEKMVGILKATEGFNPNEEEFKVATVADMHKNMLAKTKKVHETFVPFNNARSHRDEVFYNSPDNMVDIFNAAKDYMLSILDAGSAEYKAVAKIRFRKE